jgi:hypothetical protein
MNSRILRRFPARVASDIRAPPVQTAVRVSRGTRLSLIGNECKHPFVKQAFASGLDNEHAFVV